jgi:hypothetical protein
MAESTLTALAARLTDHADSIVKVAAHQLETDLREAAAVIREIEAPTPVMPKLSVAISTPATACWRCLAGWREGEHDMDPVIELIARY